MKNKKTNPLSRQVGTSPLTGRINSKSGQVAVIVLLVSAVVLTLGLSTSRKSITDIKVNTDEESLKNAFNMAESAINNYLDSGSQVYTGSGDNYSGNVTKTNIGGANSLSSEGLVSPNSSQLFWLVNHNANGSIGTTYYSGNINSISSSENNVALKIDYFYIQGGAYKVDRYACQYFGFSSTKSLGFDSPCSSFSLNYVSGKKSLLLSITPIGLATKLTLNGSSPFPVQGEELTSVGTANNGVKTQIKARNLYQIPSFLTEAVVARNIIK